MIDCVDDQTAHLFGDVLPAQFRLRHRIFVQRQGWDLRTYRGMEYDQYDTPASVYLVWRDPEGETRGIARLNPTDRPYMLRELFPEFVEAVPLPNSKEVWEGTRFGVDRALNAGTRKRVIGELLCACLEFGLQAGICQYIVLMPTYVLNHTFPKAGCKSHLVGRSRRLGSDLVAAALCDVSQWMLANVREKTGIHAPVLRTSTDFEIERAA